MFTAIIIVVGLIVFEVINSIDNAIVKVHMLRTMNERARRMFLIWGTITAVILMRGLLPFLLVYLTVPELTLMQAVQATFGENPVAEQAIETSSYIVLLGGGIFLILLYFEWLFLEKKDPYFVPDKMIKPHHRVWFFAVTALMLVLVLWLAQERPLAMLSAAVGNAAFFILFSFREMAEKAEHELEKPGQSDIAKILYLQVLDASFSIDSVVGAFAFTTSVLLILIGNGVGAAVMQYLTVKGINSITKYKWLKNGAMTSIGMLGVFMIVEAFDVHVPAVLPTIVTVGIVGWSFVASHIELKRNIQIEVAQTA